MATDTVLRDLDWGAEVDKGLHRPIEIMKGDPDECAHCGHPSNFHTCRIRDGKTVLKPCAACNCGCRNFEHKHLENKYERAN